MEICHCRRDSLGEVPRNQNNQLIIRASLVRNQSFSNGQISSALFFLKMEVIDLFVNQRLALACWNVLQRNVGIFPDSNTTNAPTLTLTLSLCKCL